MRDERERERKQHFERSKNREVEKIEKIEGERKA